LPIVSGKTIFALCADGYAFAQTASALSEVMDLYYFSQDVTQGWAKHGMPNASWEILPGSHHGAKVPVLLLAVAGAESSGQVKW
jgi:hypothetical protein